MITIGHVNAIIGNINGANTTHHMQPDPSMYDILPSENIAGKNTMPKIIPNIIYNPKIASI